MDRELRYYWPGWAVIRLSDGRIWVDYIDHLHGLLIFTLDNFLLETAASY